MSQSDHTNPKNSSKLHSNMHVYVPSIPIHQTAAATAGILVLLISHKVISCAWFHWNFKIRLWGRKSKFCFHPSSQGAALHSRGYHPRRVPPRVLQSSSTAPFQSRELKPREVKWVVQGHTAEEEKILISKSGYNSKYVVLFPTPCDLDYNTYIKTVIGSNSQCQPFHPVWPQDPMRS